MTDTTSRWRKRVERWRASGETAEVFSGREGFAPSTLRWWSSKLARTKSPAPAPMGMVQLVRVPAAPVAKAGRGAVVIDLVDVKARVTVEPGVDAATLATVLAALGVRGAA